jgi:hypothetical protein
MEANDGEENFPHRSTFLGLDDAPLWTCILSEFG